MAEARRLGTDQHLVRAGLVDLNLFNLKRFAHFAQHGSFHFGVSRIVALKLSRLFDGSSYRCSGGARQEVFGQVSLAI